MRRIATLFVVGLILTVSQSWAEGVVLRTSHVDSVTAMRHDDSRGLLVTAGVDGKVKIWNLADGSLERSAQISNLSILDIALHPERAEVALVESDENRRYRLSVWNWESGETRYTKNLTSQPLHVEYSPQGSYLMVSTASFRSMRVYEAQTGRAEEYLERGFGIVSFFAVASSEARVMTYSATNGQIIYWDLQSGFEIQRSESEQGLEQMVLFSNRRYAAAIRNRSLFLVDVLGGQVVDRVELGGSTLDMVLEDDGSAVSILLFDRRGERVMRSYALRDGRLNRRYSATYRQLPEEATRIVYAGDELYVAERDGALHRFGRYQRRPDLFAENLIRRITDIATGRNELLVAFDGRLLTLESDLFAAPEVAFEEVDQVRDTYTSLPFEEEVRLSQAPDGTTYIWSPEASEELYRLGRFSTPLPVNAEIEGQPTAITARRPGQLAVVTRDGRVSLVSTVSGDETFSVQALGIETAIETEDHGVLIGKSVTGPLDSALLRIDPLTGERVPLDTELFLIYRLTYDERARRLYALGLRRDGENRIETVLQMFYGRELQRRRNLYTVSGEFLNADLAVDSEAGEIYTTLGESGIRRYDGRNFVDLSRDAHQARRITLYSGLVLGLNRDGSLSAWSRRSREYIATFYILGPRQWIAITDDGRYVASPGLRAETYVSVDGEPEAFRLKL